MAYTVLSINLSFQRGRDGGWCAIGAPPEYKNDGDDDKLEPYMINENLIEMIAETPQPEALNLDIIKKNKDSVGTRKGGTK